MVQAVEQHPTPVRGAKLWPMSVEAYHVLGEAGVIADNTELLYGQIYTKKPKSPLHSFLLCRLIEWLQLLKLPGLFARAEQPLTFVDSEPEPDIAVVKGRNEDFRAAHPQTAQLVIEICVSRHDYDRSKLRAYAQAQVKECWLILAPEKQIEVYSQPKDGAFAKLEIVGPGGILQSQAAPGVSVDLEALFAESNQGNL